MTICCSFFLVLRNMKKWLGRGIWWVEVNVREHFRVYGWECVCASKIDVCLLFCWCLLLLLFSFCHCIHVCLYVNFSLWSHTRCGVSVFLCVRFLMDFSLVSLSTTCFLAFSVSASYSTTSITEFVWLRHRFRVSSRVFGWLDTVSYVVDCFCWRSVTTHYVSFS